MLNKKGQALIEFVLILPIVLLLIFSSIDLFSVMLKKNDLVNKLDDELLLVKKDKKTLENLTKDFKKDNVVIEINKNKDYIEVTAKQKVDWFSPTTKLVLKDYTITVKRVIPLE